MKYILLTYEELTHYANKFEDLCNEKDKEIERLKTELQETKEHLGEYLHEQEEENKRLNNIINKGIEYIKQCKELDFAELDLLEILEGVDK